MAPGSATNIGTRKNAPSASTTASAVRPTKKQPTARASKMPGLDQAPAQHLHLASVFLGRAIVLGRVFEQPLHGLEARAAQCARVGMDSPDVFRDAGGAALDGATRAGGEP